MRTCRSCGARIVWARTPGGKAIPLDAEPDAEHGNVLLGIYGGRGSALVLAGNELASSRARRDTLYTSHFATCPDADEHRR